MSRTSAGRKALILSTDGAAVGGVTRVVLGLSGTLQTLGWRVTTVFPASIDDPAALNSWAESAGTTATVSTSWLRDDGSRLRSFFALFWLARSERADVIHLHYGGTHVPLKDVVAVTLGARRRPVVSLHSPVPWNQQPRLRRRTTRVASWLTRRLTPCCSSIARLLGEAGVARRRISVVHGGVEPPRESPTRAAARATLAVPAGAFVVASVVRLSPEKAVDDLIRAVASLSGPDAFLVLKGDRGPSRPQVELLLEQLLPGRYLLLESDADNEPVYTSADIFALSSLLEGFPLVLLEAAARDLPLVATDVGSVGDFVEDGANGFLVPCADPLTMSKALSRLRDDAALRERMGHEGRQRVEEKFTVRRMVSAYLAAYGLPEGRAAATPTVAGVLPAERR